MNPSFTPSKSRPRSLPVYAKVSRGSRLRRWRWALALWALVLAAPVQAGGAGYYVTAATPAKAAMGWYESLSAADQAGRDAVTALVASFSNLESFSFNGPYLKRTRPSSRPDVIALYNDYWDTTTLIWKSGHVDEINYFFIGEIICAPPTNGTT